MAKPSDQVFQLSLTEIAFTIVFILLLLLGWMLFESKERMEQLEARVAEAGDVRAITEVLNEAKARLTELLTGSGAAKPDEVVSELVAQKKLVQERETLRKRIEDLDAQVTALAEIKQALAEASGKNKNETIQKQIQSALALQAMLEQHLADQERQAASEAEKDGQEPARAVPKKDAVTEAKAALAMKIELEKQMKQQLGKGIERGKETRIAKELVENSRHLQDIKRTAGTQEAMRKDNADLRGQLAFLKGKLESRGGRDYPPCWAEEKTGKLEYLFTIEIHADGLRITPGWPPGREADARALPGVDQLLSPARHSLDEFSSRMQGIDSHSKARGCRHYVYLRNRVDQLDIFNRYRYGVENFFYKLELRS